MRRAVSLFGTAIVCVAAAALLYSAEISTPATSQPTSITSSSKLSPRTGEQIAYINDFIHQGWQAHNLHPSPVATDGEWCRRLYLDLLGRIPSVDEVEQYTRDHSTEKKANLVNRMLSDEYRRRVRTELEQPVDDHSHRSAASGKR